MLRGLWNAFTTEHQEVQCDLSQTPWKLCLKNPRHPLEIFLYFSTHEEAKDQEDICCAKGWTSLGVVWYN